MSTDPFAPRHAPASTALRERVVDALAEGRLRADVATAADRFAARRSSVLAELDDPDGLRHAARHVRQQVLARLPELLERFADAATRRGAQIYWASTAVEARDYVARIVQAHDAQQVVKSTSAVTAEIELDAALRARGIDVVEADEPVGFARDRLREAYLTADVGITGADMAVAETGSIVLVTDQGNGRLVTSLPRAHVVVLGMERLVANWHQADLLLGLLARSASGQRPSSYTTVVSGPRGRDELNGPDELHIVVVDDGAGVLGHASTFCAACLDACPVEIPLQAMVSSLHRDAADATRRDERTAWRLWAGAWSDARRYDATMRTASWSRLATGLAGRLPVASSWAGDRTLPKPATERFRDRWRKGLV
ncbi:MAG: LUD domain-containing protein [Acidimicrobiales bacterium]